MTASGLPEEPATGAAQANAEPAVPDDPQRLEEEIERTRKQLGETVEQLAAKMDVKSIAQAKTAEVAGRAKSATARARDQAAARAGSVRGQLAGTAATARKKASSAGQAGVIPVRKAVATGTSTAKEYRTPLALAAVSVITGSLGVWQWRKPQAGWHAQHANHRRR